jgi:TP901 family phage tail tape measure protein
MNINEFAASIKLTFDAGAFSAGISTAKKSISDLEKNVDSAQKNIIEKGKLLNDAFKVSSDAELKSKISSLNQSFEALKKSGTASLLEIRRAEQSLIEQTNALKKEIYGIDFSQVSKTLSAASLAGTTLGIASAAKAAISLHDAMIDIKTVGDFTPEGLEKLKNEIQELSQKIPLATGELAKIGQSGVQANIPTSELKDYIATVAKISFAFKILPDAAGDAFGKIGNVFKLNVAQVALVGDAINKLADSTASVTEKPLLDVVQRSAGAGQSFGLVAQQVAALGATLLSVGTSIEVSGSSINSLLSTLGAAEGGTKDFKSAMEKLGFGVKDFAQSVSKDGQGALIGLLEKLAELDQNSRNNAINKLFGKGEDAEAIKKLVLNLELYKTTLAKVAKETDSAGNVNKAFKTTLEAFSAQWQIFKNNISVAAQSLGEVFLPILSGALKIANSFASAIAGLSKSFPVFTTLSTVVAGAAASFVALKVVAGVVSTILLKIGATTAIAASFSAIALSVGKISTAMSVLGLNPVFVLLAAGAVIVTTFKVITDYSENNPSAKPVGFGLDSKEKEFRNSFNYNPRNFDPKTQRENNKFASQVNATNRFFESISVSAQNDRELKRLTAPIPAKAIPKPLKSASTGGGKVTDFNTDDAKDEKDKAKKEFKELENITKALDKTLKNNELIFFENSSKIENLSNGLSQKYKKIISELEANLSNGLISSNAYREQKMEALRKEFNNEAVAMVEESNAAVAKVKALNSAKNDLLNLKGKVKSNEQKESVEDEINKIYSQIREEGQKQINIKEGLNLKIKKLEYDLGDIDKEAALVQKALDEKPLNFRVEMVEAQQKVAELSRNLASKMQENNENGYLSFAKNIFGGQDLIRQEENKNQNISNENKLISAYEQEIEAINKVISLKKEEITLINGAGEEADKIIAENQQIKEKIKNVEEYNNKITESKIKILDLENSGSGLKSIADAIGGGFGTLFENITRGTLSAKDAFKQFGITALQAISDVLKEALKLQAIKFLNQAFGLGGAASGGLITGGLNGYAKGGIVGAGLSAVLSGIGGYAHASEYVFSPEQVKQIGLNNLNLMNRGINPFLQGYTGDGGKYDFAGFLQKGSFVINKEATQKLNLDNLSPFDDLKEFLKKQKGFADGGSVGGTEQAMPLNNNQVQVLQPVINITNNTNSKVEVDNSRFMREQVINIVIDDIDQGGSLGQRLKR